MKRLHFRQVILIVTILVIVAFPMLATAQDPAEDEEVMTPEEVLIALTEYINGGELEKAADLYADNAVVMLLPSPPFDPPFVGKKAVTGWLAGLIEQNFQGESETLETYGNILVTELSFEDDGLAALGVTPFVGTVIYVVQNGQISVHLFVTSDESLADFMEAIGAMQEADADSN